MLQANGYSINKQVMRTRSWVVEALLLLLDEKPYSKINISDITEKAGIARQTFYRNYESKDDIIVKFVDDLFAELRVRVNEEAKKQAGKNESICLFDMLMENRSLILKILNADLEHIILKHLKTYNELFLSHLAKNTSVQEPPVKERYSIIYQVGGMAYVVLDWLKNGMVIPPEEMGSIISEMTKSFRTNSNYLANLI